MDWAAVAEAIETMHRSGQPGAQAGLQVRGLRAGYGQARVLHGVDFAIRPAETVALLGRNGAGRSTALRAIMGLLPGGCAQGAVHWRGQPLLGLPPHRIARQGLGYVPETRDIFTRLDVLQNLRLGQRAGHALVSSALPAWSLQDCFAHFPVLARRRHAPAGALSGGEQKMLALCRALLGAPALLLADEPTEGLSPQMARQVALCLRDARARGMAVLLVEQKMAIALDLADRVLVMGQGRIVFEGTPAQLRQRPDVARDWLAL